MFKLDGHLIRPYPHSKASMPTRSIRRRVDFYLCKIGAKRKKLSTHGLRSGSVTLLMEENVGLLELQAFLGHANPETTMKYIARLDQKTNKLSDKIPLKFN